MTNKIYVKLKRFLQENLFSIVLLTITIIMAVVKLPIYIDMPGGLLNTKDRVKIENSYKSEGSFNMTYVSEVKANIPLYLFALINKNWDIVKEKDMTVSNMTIDEINEYGKITMRESNKDAIKIAYEKAGYEVKEKNSNAVIIYRYSEANTDLVVGDVVTSFNGEPVNNVEDLTTKIKDVKVGERINLEVINNEKKYNRYAQIIEVDGEPKIGIMLLETRDIITNPKCELSYSSNESGSSGGLMTTLTIYNNLISEDLTHGLKISGTGTIEKDGTVGEIAGVKYKLIGAVKKKAKIFFVPDGENYKEALKVKEKRKYNIEIVPVKTFEDAVNFLENYKTT